MKTFIISFTSCVLGIYIAWYFDNKAFKNYKDEIKQLKNKIRLWEISSGDKC